MNVFTAKWPFYISGCVYALLVVLALYLFDDVIGLGDAMTVSSEYGQQVITEQKIGGAPSLDWQLGILIGLFAGALAAGLSVGKFKPEFLREGSGSFTVRAMWTAFGGFAGGFLVMLGVQLGGDSVFGQLAAAMQLSGGAWIFLIAMTITGCGLTILLDRRGESGGGSSEAAPAAKAPKKKAKGRG